MGCCWVSINLPAVVPRPTRPRHRVHPRRAAASSAPRQKGMSAALTTMIEISAGGACIANNAGGLRLRARSTGVPSETPRVRSGERNTERRGTFAKYIISPRRNRPSSSDRASASRNSRHGAMLGLTSARTSRRARFIRSGRSTAVSASAADFARRSYLPRLARS